MSFLQFHFIEMKRSCLKNWDWQIWLFGEIQTDTVYSSENFIFRYALFKCLRFFGLLKRRLEISIVSQIINALKKRCALQETVWERFSFELNIWHVYGCKRLHLRWDCHMEIILHITRLTLFHGSFSLIAIARLLLFYFSKLQQLRFHKALWNGVIINIISSVKRNNSR